MPTRDEIMNALTGEREQLLTRYQAFTPEELEQACTQSETPGGAPWSPKDHLAHLTLIERAFQGMVRRSLKGDTDPVGFSRTGAQNREEVLAWIHRNNQAYVDAHHLDSLHSLLSDLDQARNDTLAMLANLTDEQLVLPLKGAPWADGTIGGVLGTNAHHEHIHLDWVEEGLSKQ